ncbi:Sugar kinase of the NBD/HSP70 family, may contain an N-terminal HTH domain [Sediminibacillus albus]|uniref:Sugar kinase of the NBD/HSP70 family, may contain an N-terminal HTH domain n=2 Tax=Sediminibacillus albus TaxID=407036 RepID=A0A1G8YHR6_9BACI|nr:Sugar kinase of the NBD/HSP70 family, may contain an N-terminal HTH domain [Sediminibacillus albus]
MTIINQTWNQHVVKKGNKSLVLETIKDNYPISRAETANRTGLNKGTVSSLVSELISEQLISESGPGESSGGRRPVMLLFNQLAGYSIGIDIGVNYLLGVLTDLQGNICNEKRMTYSKLSYEEIKTSLFAIIDELITSAPPSPYGIIGIGVGVPGTVSNTGEILLAPNLDWKNIHLQAVLERKYELPVVIENEANAGAYGEKKFGAGKDADNIIYVSAGIGIGVGLILNGALYKGNNGFSGELGHMTIEVDGNKCRCGNKGCWELYASEQALLTNAVHSDIDLPAKEVTLENLANLAEDGDAKTIELFETVGDYLGVGINNIINIFNPEQVIIGNRMATSKKWLREPLITRMVNQTLWFQQKGLQIDFSELSTHSTALGMAAFSVENFLEVDIQPKEVF